MTIAGKEFPDDDYNPEEVDERLRARGAFAEYDEDGQVRRLTLSGDVYDNSSIESLSAIDGLDVLDVRETRITTGRGRKPGTGCRV